MSVTRIGSRDKVPRQRRFLASTTWVVPNGVTWVKARIVGAGAAGRASLSNGSGYGGISPVAGSSGGEVIDCILSCTPGASMPVTVAGQTLATVFSNVVAVSQENSLVSGAASSFGGVSARGGITDLENIGLVSMGPLSGYGAGLYAAVNFNTAAQVIGTHDVSGTSGPDGYGAGSGSLRIDQNGGSIVYAPPGPGGVRGRLGLVQAAGYDAPANSGAGGGPLTGYSSGNSIGSWRGGNGGSGIVILDWEEYA